MPPPPPNREEKAVTEPTDPIVELLDTARALRVLAQGLNGEDGESADLPQGGKPGLACILRLLADNLDKNAQRLDA